ncbi:uncharacterized protein SPPG_08107 [Spizellomyces punctatus DAOM BR117]|uniref:Uncharacterized protein n=1 Tax=Spizellomyces punctatus (strain DAOM BR117) TaxID=645134 RepID=A0A0L0H6C0_SPIPD|nr:uncharacterized protein SPPG_08107 [Spizellomyces punctatus DAOM BR117]KNC96519.1 hypothetical protein SPPG_08107 [Spizellomyces punctatus DAOM BR117]|eukprot:XP_016604559.1 hypothetical protein SPPG_08107 [Spizellomyces punctatus DAOM BR117]
MKLSRYGINPLLPYQPVTATDVVFLNLRGVHFRVSSAVLGLFPDSVLMNMFPTGIIPFFSVVSGREATATVPGVRMGAAAAAAAAITQAMESRRMSDPNPQPTGRKSSSAAQDSARRASFAGGNTLSKSTALSWQKYYNSESGEDAEPEDDMESLSETSSDDDGEEFDNRESEKSEKTTPFRPAEDSLQMDLTGVEQHKICHINFDPKLFQFLLDYFRQILNSNHDAMVAAHEEMHRQQEEQQKIAEAAVPPVSLDKVEEENSAPHESAKIDTAPEQNPDTKPEVNQDDEESKSAASSPTSVEGNMDGKVNGKWHGIRRPSSFNIFRRMSGLKFSIVTFFSGHEQSPSALGPQPTPSVGEPPVHLNRPIRSIIVLREELEYFPIPKWVDAGMEAGSKVESVWEAFKSRLRRSFSKASAKVALNDNSNDSLQKFREGVEMDEMRGAVTNDAFGREVKEVKIFCAERLVKERVVARKYAEESIEIFEKGEKERPGGTERYRGSRGSGSRPSVDETEKNASQSQGLTERERVVCEMDEQILKGQLISALGLFSADFKHDQTEWDFREIEAGKCRVSSVSMLKMRELQDIQRAVDAAAATMESSKPSPESSTSQAEPGILEESSAGRESGAGRRASDVQAGKDKSSASNAQNASSLVTQVSDAGAPPSVSSHHLNQHLLMKRPVRKCWWEVMTIRMDTNWLERRRSSLAAEEAQKASKENLAPSTTSVSNERQSEEGKEGRAPATTAANDGNGGSNREEVQADVVNETTDASTTPVKPYIVDIPAESNTSVPASSDAPPAQLEQSAPESSSLLANNSTADADPGNDAPNGASRPEGVEETSSSLPDPAPKPVLPTMDASDTSGHTFSPASPKVPSTGTIEQKEAVPHAPPNHEANENVERVSITSSNVPQSSSGTETGARVRVPPEIPLPPSPTNLSRPASTLIKVQPVDIRLWVRRTWTIEFCSM